MNFVVFSEWIAQFFFSLKNQIQQKFTIRFELAADYRLAFNLISALYHSLINRMLKPNLTSRSSNFISPLTPIEAAFLVVLVGFKSEVAIRAMADAKSGVPPIIVFPAGLASKPKRSVPLPKDTTHPILLFNTVASFPVCPCVGFPFLVPFKSRLFHSFGSSLAPLGSSGAKA